MNKLALWCLVSVIVYITSMVVTAYSVVGTMPPCEPFDRYVPLTTLFILSLPAILGFTAGTQIDRR